MVKRYLCALSGVIFLLLLIGLAGYDRVKVKSIQVRESKIPIDTNIKGHRIYLGSDGYLNLMFIPFCRALEPGAKKFPGLESGV